MSKESKKLLHAIGEIDDQLIENAATDKKRRSFYRWGYGIAACFVAVLSVGVCIHLLAGDIASSSSLPAPSPALSEEFSGQSASSSNAVILGSLPTVTPWQTYEHGGGGMGFEGYMATDISELKNANPWTEDASLETLPVFHNVYASTVEWGEEGRTARNLPLLEGKKTTAEEMEALARSIADDLGVTVTSVKVDPTEEYLAAVKEKLERVGDTLSEQYTLPTRVTLSCSGDIVIHAYPDLTARIEFNTPVALPEEYYLGHHASYEEMTAAGEYLMKEYGSLLHMEKPTLNIYGGDRNIYGEQSFSCYVYEGTGDLTQQILNYHFNTVRFAPNDDGKLWLIDFTRLDLSDKLGDYPIYTVEEAQKKLEEGHYITTVPENFPGTDKIKKVELVYKGQGQITVMPYYRFYVELSKGFWPEGTADNGEPMKDYGAYYVVAVREEYINQSVWDGSFN